MFYLSKDLSPEHGFALRSQSRLVVCIGSPANTMSTPGCVPGALLLSPLSPLSPPFATAAELLPAIAVTANDAAALVRELLPPEQAELALRSPLLQANLAPFCDQTQRQLELLQLARPAKRLCRAVVVGLDGVGKTSILTALRTGRAAPNSLLQIQAEDVAPTQGCNKSALYRDDVSGRWTPESGDHASFGLELLNVGGGSGERQHWPQLAVGSTAILAVVDGRETDAARCSSWS